MIGSSKRNQRQTLDHSAKDSFFKNDSAQNKRATVVQPPASASINAPSQKEMKQKTSTGDRIDRENCVTLYNTDKLDALPCITNSQNKSELPPSREYQQNLEKSFSYTPIEVSAHRSITEDCQIMFASMQNLRLWQLSKKSKYLLRMKISEDLSGVIQTKAEK